MAPPVSVITVVHNGMPYLPATVESILSQRFSEFEYIIVDDGSTDGTQDYLRRVNDPRVRLIRCERIGLANVRNVAINEAKGEFLSNIDADDIAYADRLSRQVEFLRHNTGHVVVGSQADLIDCSGNVVGERRFPCSDAALRFRILFGCPFLHPTTTYRREATLKCGGFRAQYNFTEDYDLWTRLSLEGRMANLPSKLAAYRIHESSVTSQYSDVHTQHSCQMVYEYARRLGICVDESIGNLFYFLQHGHADEDSTSAMVECYRRIREHFRNGSSVDAELQEQMQFVQQRLRWHCLDKALKSVPNLPKFWRWLRLAGKFDPENGTLLRTALRAARKTFQ